MIPERDGKTSKWRMNVPIGHGWTVTELLARDENDTIVCLGLEKDGKRIDPPYARWDTGKCIFLDDPWLQLKPWFDAAARARVNEAIVRATDGERVALVVETDRETDGRWIAEVNEIPGVLAYGETEEKAVAAAKALALRRLAEKIERGETPASLGSVVFRLG